MQRIDIHNAIAWGLSLVQDVAHILDDLKSGNAAAAQLLLIVYEELWKLAAHKMAHESPWHTLQPTALVHEAWLRLLKPEEHARFENRAHFFGVAAEASRCKFRRYSLEVSQPKSFLRGFTRRIRVAG
jgi:hypothetical protein